MLDKYANWPSPFEHPFIPSIGQRSIEEEVLHDLAAAGEDEMLKLDILDGYAAYYQKVYRAQVVNTISDFIGHQASSFLAPWLKNTLPEVRFVHRAAQATSKQ